MLRIKSLETTNNALRCDLTNLSNLLKKSRAIKLLPLKTSEGGDAGLQNAQTRVAWRYLKPMLNSRSKMNLAESIRARCHAPDAYYVFKEQTEE